MTETIQLSRAESEAVLTLVNRWTWRYADALRAVRLAELSNDTADRIVDAVLARERRRIADGGEIGGAIGPTQPTTQPRGSSSKTHAKPRVGVTPPAILDADSRSVTCPPATQPATPSAPVPVPRPIPADLPVDRRARKAARPYACGRCGEAFRYPCYAARHEARCPGLPDQRGGFDCPTCGLRMRTARGLHRHQAACKAGGLADPGPPTKVDRLVADGLAGAAEILVEAGAGGIERVARLVALGRLTIPGVDADACAALADCRRAIVGGPAGRSGT